MKIHSLGCKSPRDGVMTALVFTITGMFLVLTAFFILPKVWFLPHILVFFGALILLLVPLILTATFLKFRSSNRSATRADTPGTRTTESGSTESGSTKIGRSE